MYFVVLILKPLEISSGVSVGIPKRFSLEIPSELPLGKLPLPLLIATEIPLGKLLGISLKVPPEMYLRVSSEIPLAPRGLFEICNSYRYCSKNYSRCSTEKYPWIPTGVATGIPLGITLEMFSGISQKKSRFIRPDFFKEWCTPKNSSQISDISRPIVIA